MGDKSKIHWCDSTWNPTTGCTKVSEGCLNCYAEKMAARLKAMGAARYKDGFAVRCHDDILEQPMRWRRPRKIFVNSMSDLFHHDVPFDFVDKVFAVMAMSQRHTFIILTKRPERMREYITRHDKRSDGAYACATEIRNAWANRLGEAMYQVTTNDEAECQTYNRVEGCLANGYNAGWPLRNVWIGVTTENQKQANIRIPILADTPAARRFVSCEPLLEPISLAWGAHRLDWVIVGGESGPKARDIKVEWVRSLRNQAVTMGAAFFFKQWSAATMYQVVKDNGLPAFDGKTYAEYPKAAEDPFGRLAVVQE